MNLVGKKIILTEKQKGFRCCQITAFTGTQSGVNFY